MRSLILPNYVEPKHSTCRLKLQRLKKLGMIAAQVLFRKRRELSKRVAEFHDCIRRYCPLLPPATCSEYPEMDVLTLPSYILTSDDGTPLFSRTAVEWEITLRVGLGHDTLGNLRRALGIKSCLLRHHRRDNRGNAAVEKGNNNIANAQNRVELYKGIYKHNWGNLKSLAATPDDLHGLQELGDDHLKLLSDWIGDRDYRRSAAPLPWIWAVPRSSLEGVPSPDDFETIALSWSQEGKATSWLQRRLQLLTYHLICSFTPRVASFSTSSRAMEGRGDSSQRGIKTDCRMV